MDLKEKIKKLTWYSFQTVLKEILGEINQEIIDIRNSLGEFISYNSFTGWAVYSDDEYTQASPFVAPADEQNYTLLPNNAANVLEIQKPTDIDTFYDPATQTITGRNGDGLSWSIEMRASPSVNNAWIEMGIDIGGSVGIIYPDSYTFPRGAGVERSIIYKIPSAYTLDTWEANGGQVKFKSNAQLSIHTIRYVPTRTHKAR